jgi:hypothetical protein
MDYDQLLQTIRLLQAEFSVCCTPCPSSPNIMTLDRSGFAEDFILVGNDKKFPAYQQAFSLQLLWEA